MYEKEKYNFLKYKLFFIADLCALELSVLAAYYIRHGNLNNIFVRFGKSYLYLNIVMVFIYLMYGIILDPYKDIIKKSVYRIALDSLIGSLIVTLFSMAFMFFAHTANVISRFFLIYFLLFCFILVFVLRILIRFVYIHTGRSVLSQKGIIIIASEDDYARIVERFLGDKMSYYSIRGIGIAGAGKGIPESYKDIKLYKASEILDCMKERWIDECYISVSAFGPEVRDFIRKVQDAGITCCFDIENLVDPNYRYTAELMGGNLVIMSSMVIIDQGQALLKRLMDIVGSIVGLAFTGLFVITIGPAIYFADKGPIFFKQKRIGLNGRIFNMYKFRSMYMDAEERKKDLMLQNELDSDLMFKIKDDPRIIKGIGNFIRKTSIDEFPQFLNVLKGDMSLVGTRPPTVDEWARYDLEHRKRMAVKPGITGVWQTSGRSDILDFEEVVRLDASYMKDWSIAKDIKIIFTTMTQIFKGKGAS